MKRTSQSRAKRGAQSQRARRDTGVPGGGRGRKDVVRGSRVYPISGPWPKGEAEIRTEAAWGQGARGAAGYEDSGRSELSPLPKPGRGARAGARAGAGQRRTATGRSTAGQEIPRSRWVRFFDAFSKDHDGWPTSVEVTPKGKGKQVEARKLPLQGVTVDLKPQDKDTTSIILDMQPNVHLTHTVPETIQVIFREDQQELEIASSSGDKAVIHFQRPGRR
ncbi:MAG: hypothetical protein JWR69_4653 [Pedosphaera sp.]|nr:hypothetical protein [Pedosphaera sp.]